jgi:hypothetical protein
MPLIQRNLFPRRPPSKKCNGPSVLQAGDTGNDNSKRAKNSISGKSNEKLIFAKLSNAKLIDKSIDKNDAVIIAQRLALQQSTTSSVNFLESSESSNSDSRYVSILSF